MLENLILGLLGVTTLGTLGNLAWSIFGARATTEAKTLAKEGFDAAATDIEKLPVVQQHAILLALVQKADTVGPALVNSEIDAAAAVISKDGFTAQAAKDLGPAAWSAFKASLSSAESTLLSLNPGTATTLQKQIVASAKTAVSAMKTYKLASGAIVKLPAGAPLPEAGAVLIASA